MTRALVASSVFAASLMAVFSLAALMVGPAALAQFADDEPETKKAEPAKPADAKPAETKPSETKPSETKPADPFVLGYTMKDIDGKDQKLDQYRGKVVMIVNVASKCGLTPQYKGLEKLYTDKKDKGFVILAFPANNFAGQEPGKDADIKDFCTGPDSDYKVTFPIFSKISVRGEEQHPLYKQLAGQPKPIGGEPSWNFAKFIINREGKVVDRFEPRIDPNDSTLVKRIDDLLAQPAPAAAKSADKPADAKPADAKPGETPKADPAQEAVK